MCSRDLKPVDTDDLRTYCLLWLDVNSSFASLGLEILIVKLVSLFLIRIPDTEIPQSDST